MASALGASTLEQTAKATQGNATEWIISLITGAIGGNVAGAIFKNLTLGPLGNTLAGVVGGGVGAEILNALTGAGVGGGSVAGNIASSGVGSVVIMLIVGVIKNAVTKKA